tara:strand:- start:66 stop:656 length:591 start_codon:yes stop_codon:yes gene_type:complete
MNKANALILFLICSVSILLLGCKESKIGKYINKSNSSEFIVLNENKSFVLEESGLVVKGQYEIHDRELKLSFNFGETDYTVRASIEDGIIKDEKNKYWKKSITLSPFLVALVASILAITVIAYSNKIPNKYLQSMFQLGGVYAGIAIMVPFAETALQVREVHGKYYFYILIVSAVIYKIIKTIKSKQANKKSQSDA